MNVPDRLYLFILILFLSSSCLTDYSRQGETLMAGQKYDEALICFDKILSSEPDNIKALNGKGECLVKLEKYDQAIDCFNKALSLDPNNADIWLNKGGALYKKYYYELEPAKSDSKDFITFDPFTGTGILNDHRDMGEKEKEIKACLDKVLEIEANPDNPDGWYRKGLAFYYMGDYADGENCFDEIISYFKIDSSAIENLQTGISDEHVKILKTLMNKKFSRKELRYSLRNSAFTEEEISLVADSTRYVKLEKRNEKAIYFTGCCLFSRKDYEGAIEYLDWTLWVNPRNMDAFIMKSDLLYSQEKYDEAVKCLDEALKVNPGAYAVLINKAFILYNMKNYEEAIKSIDKALEFKTDVYVLTLKGASLYNRGIYEEAITFYDKALDINSRYIDAITGKGYALYRSGKPDEGLECFNKALEIDPENVSALAGKGPILLERKDYKGALSCYDRLIAIKRDSSEFYFYKAKALTGLGNYREVLKCYDKALDLDPSYEEASRDREKFIKDYHISWNILESIAMVKKGYARLRSYVYSSDKRKEAMKCFDCALELDPENTDAWVGKADTLTDFLGYTDLEYGLSDSEDCEKALECYDMALKIQPSNDSFYGEKLSILKLLVGKGDERRRNYYNEEILKICSKRLNIDPYNWRAYEERVYAFSSLGLQEEARKSFDEFLTCCPPDEYSERAECCFFMGFYKEALEYQDKVLNRYPDYYSDRVSSVCREIVMREIEFKGDILYKDKKYSEAILCYEEAYKIWDFLGSHDFDIINSPDGDPGLRKLTVMEKELSDMVSLPAKEKSPHEWVQIGHALEDLSKSFYSMAYLSEKAGKCFEKARELDPNMNIN